MGKVRSALIQLQPANNAVIGKIFCDPRFRDAQVLGKLRLDGIRTSAAGSAAQEIPNGDAQGLTRFDVVIARRSESVRTNTPGPTGAWSASPSFTGGQVSSRRSCISRSDKREERPGSPERPRTLAPAGSPSGSRGKVGIERLSATRGGRGSAGSASSLDGRVFSDSADCETFVAEPGISVEAPFGAPAFR